MSEPVALDCGVPQGSVLGSLLFLVYTASLSDETHTDGVTVDQFSDDTQARAAFSFKRSSFRARETLATPTHSHRNSPGSNRSNRRGSSLGRQNRNRRRGRQEASHYEFSSQADATAALSTWASAADKWFTTNHVRCNIEKTVVMYATPNEQKPERTNLQVGASSLPPSAECRHLGLTIDSRLTLASHVRAVCRSARYHLWRISKFRRSLDLASTMCLVNSLVISRLDYANSLFFRFT